MMQRIHTLVRSDINFDDERVPTGICNICRLQLKKKEIAAVAGDLTFPMPNLYDFKSILVKPVTRTSNICDCIICKIGKLKLKEKHPLLTTKTYAQSISINQNSRI